jgi:predicted adenylyl cyclase CyaB
MGRLIELGHHIIELRQVDRYYRVANGRLKMRWQDDRAAELIRYSRPDLAGDRLSTYHLLRLELEQSAFLDELFLDQVGELVTVRKVREVGIIGHTRVHLDDVDGLGRFVELETVLGDGPDAEEAGRVEYENVVKLLGLNKLEPIAGSYSDLLMGRERDTCE